MKTSSLDPRVPAQPLSQRLELPLSVAWTEAAGVSWVGRVGELRVGEGELSRQLRAARGLWLEIRTVMGMRRCGGRTNRKKAVEETVVQGLSEGTMHTCRCCTSRLSYLRVCTGAAVQNSCAPIADCQSIAQYLNAGCAL